MIEENTDHHSPDPSKCLNDEDENSTKEEDEGRPKDSTNLEPVLQALGGGLGRYEMCQRILQISCSLVLPVISLGIVFIGYRPDYRCNDVNSTQLHDLLGKEVSADTNMSVKYQKCSIDVTVNTSGIVTSHSFDCVTGIKFSMPSDTSVLTEWSLVCDKAGLTELSQTVVMAGRALGSAVFSNLSDLFGRRKVYTLCGIGVLIACSGFSLATNYYIFLVLRIISGFLVQGMYTPAYTMFMELMPRNWRGLASICDSVLWSLSIVIMATIGYLMEGISWRYLNLAFSCISLYTLCLPCFLDESLRWLMAKGKIEEMERILRKACRMNGKDFEHVKQVLHENIRIADPQLDINSTATDKHTEEDDGEAGIVKDKDLTSAKYNCLDIFRHKVVRVPFMVVAFVWATNALFYYGAMLGTATLAGNRFLNTGLFAIMEVFSTLVAMFLIPRFNRRTLATCYGMICGLSLLSSVVMIKLVGGSIGPKLATGAWFVGKFSLTGSYCLLFIYNLEVFPTCIRSTGMGMANFFSRVVAMTAPFVVLLGETVPWAPGLLIGSLCFLATVSIRLLPETRHRKLPDTVEEMKAWRPSGPKRLTRTVRVELSEKYQETTNAEK